MAGDNEGVKEDFLDSLKDLTFPARPVIQNLTSIAHENVNAAKVIVEAIEIHIAKTSPQYKLAAFYLLDSICKNIGLPYTALFARNLYDLYLNSYKSVEPAHRKKFEDMFQTWKLPSPVGDSQAPVFSRDITGRIDTILLKIRTATLQVQQQQSGRQITSSFQTYAAPNASIPSSGYTYPSNQPFRNTPPPSITTPPISFAAPQYGPPLSQDTELEELYNKINSAIDVARSKLLASPYDQRSRQQVGILEQLLSILQTSSLPPETLLQIRAQLANLVSEQQQQLTGTPPTTSAVSTPPLNTGAFPTRPSDPKSLLAALKSSGVLQDPSRVNNRSPASLLGRGNPSTLTPPHYGQANGSRSAFSSLPGLNPALIPVLTKNVDLSTSSLQQPRTYLIQLLYDAQPQQCRNCARRFPDSLEGQAALARHLDWHFQTNKRIRDMADRNVFRNWYFDEEEWVQYHEIDLDYDTSAAADTGSMAAQFSDASPNNHQGDSQNRPNTHQVGKQLPQQQQPYVVVPADPSSASMRCSICQEKFVSVWDDVLEEWVWRNAVKAPNENRYYHATCFADMVARPEEPGGKKRKAEDSTGS